MVMADKLAWTDEQWDKLESYLVEFGHLNSDNEYLYNFQLEFLSRYLNSEEQTVINNLNHLNQQKPIQSKNNFNWEGNKTKLINEVDNIILLFNLTPFKEITQPPIKGVFGDHRAMNDQRSQRNQRESGPGPSNEIDLLAKPPIQNLALQNDPDHSKITKPRTEIPHKKEMPKLSKAQRRTSLDLMHSRPNLSDFQHKRTGSFSKPALASTSNVNVLTKADVKAKDKSPNKFNLVLIIPKRKGHAPKENQGNTGDTLDKRTRRLSLVGENLPNYIKNQLNGERTITKKKSRVHNLLANSESLYAHSKVSGKDSAKDSGRDASANASAKSSHTGSDYDNYDQNSESEDDREYILPNLLTKYYEDQEEERASIDDNEFVNVNQLELSESERLENDDNDNDNDDYLFTM